MNGDAITITITITITIMTCIALQKRRLRWTACPYIYSYCLVFGSGPDLVIGVVGKGVRGGGGGKGGDCYLVHLLEVHEPSTDPTWVVRCRDPGRLVSLVRAHPINAWPPDMG